MLSSIFSVLAASIDERLKALEDGQALDSLVLSEQFYFSTIVVMWLIHAGFMAYEAGAARRKNVMSTAMKNILTIAVVTPTFYYFGWYIYGCFEEGWPKEGRQPGRLPRLLRPHRAMERRARAEPPGPPEPRLLPRVPTLLVDDRVDHVRRADRARPALRLSDPGRDPRVGRLDHGRGLGLELRRLADDAFRVPRLNRVARRPRRGRRLRARRAVEPRPTHREIRHQGARQVLQRPQTPISR